MSPGLCVVYNTVFVIFFINFIYIYIYMSIYVHVYKPGQSVRQRMVLELGVDVGRAYKRRRVRAGQ
jgi:hypothetical protein